MLHLPSQIDAFLLFAGDVSALRVIGNAAAPNSPGFFVFFCVRFPAETLPGVTWTVNQRLVPPRLCYSLPPDGSCTEVFIPLNPGNVGMAASGAQKCPKSEKLDEAQALAKSCAGRPDFLPCDGLSICATHSHGKCFKLHWCCHLGWCHCKFLTRDHKGVQTRWCRTMFTAARRPRKDLALACCV